MKTKRDYLREAFQIWCKVYNQPGDDWDVWFERGHWYGETVNTVNMDIPDQLVPQQLSLF